MVEILLESPGIRRKDWYSNESRLEAREQRDGEIQAGKEYEKYSTALGELVFGYQQFTQKG